jgi:putative transposase
MKYRRAWEKGGTYFFTVVTNQRKPFLCEPDCLATLRGALKKVKTHHPFSIDAIVILPDHLHCLWTLPEKDADYATRWRLVKSEFTRKCPDHCKAALSASRRKKKEQGVWQRRYWEHVIRDSKDFTEHVQYIHYNPVKHGLAASPRSWPHSSFHTFVSKGMYDLNWGAGEQPHVADGIGCE